MIPAGLDRPTVRSNATSHRGGPVRLSDYCAAIHVQCAPFSKRHQALMAKVEAVEIRVGNLIEWDKRVWRVLKCYHVHVGGRGGAFMQVEMKDIESGTKTNQRFRTEDKIERAIVEPREMEYLYQDGTSYVFMDKQNYEQLSLSDEFLEGQAGFLLPNTEVQVNFYNGRAIGVELPPSVVLTVVQTEPGIKNATATNMFKQAKLETGITVQVPPFIGQGEKIKVSTNDGSYMERA
jgi:elongation factor P